MIEIRSHIVDGKIKGKVMLTGTFEELEIELANTLAQIAERDEELVACALDRYLDLVHFLPLEELKRGHDATES